MLCLKKKHWLKLIRERSYCGPWLMYFWGPLKFCICFSFQIPNESPDLPLSCRFSFNVLFWSRDLHLCILLFWRAGFNNGERGVMHIKAAIIYCVFSPSPVNSAWSNTLTKQSRAQVTVDPCFSPLMEDGTSRVVGADLLVGLRTLVHLIHKHNTSLTEWILLILCLKST